MAQCLALQFIWVHAILKWICVVVVGGSPRKCGVKSDFFT